MNNDFLRRLYGACSSGTEPFFECQGFINSFRLGVKLAEELRGGLDDE